MGKFKSKDQRIDEIREAAVNLAAAVATVDRLCVEARTGKVTLTWAEIGEALGVSAQAAWERLHVDVFQATS